MKSIFILIYDVKSLSLLRGNHTYIVIPAQAGIHVKDCKKGWIPATARDDTVERKQNPYFLI